MHSETHEAMHVNKIMFYLKSVFYKHILDKIQNSEITAPLSNWRQLVGQNLKIFSINMRILPRIRQE